MHLVLQILARDICKRYDIFHCCKGFNSERVFRFSLGHTFLASGQMKKSFARLPRKNSGCKNAFFEACKGVEAEFERTLAGSSTTDTVSS